MNAGRMRVLLQCEVCKQGWIRVQGKVHFGFWSVLVRVCECEVCARALPRSKKGDEEAPSGGGGDGRGLGPRRSLGREQ